MVANDQHQPANSRAIAALATTGRFLALIETYPAGMQTPIGGLPAGPGGRGGDVPAAPQLVSGPIRFAMMPGRLHQKPTNVAVTGLGQTAL